MSKRRQKVVDSAPAGAPRWIPAYAALNTILLAFFICMSVNIGKHRELGYMGPGLGAFREGFTSRGLPSVLKGARRIINLFTWGGKYVPDETADGAQKSWFESRLTDPPDRDMMQVPTEIKHSQAEVRLPVPIRYSTQLTRKDREQLSSAARMARLSGRSIMVCASVPVSGEDIGQAWRNATRWAVQVARHLRDNEGIPAERLTAVGRIGAAAADSVEEPTMTLVLRNEAHQERKSWEQFGAPSTLSSPQTEYQMIRQNGRN